MQTLETLSPQTADASLPLQEVAFRFVTPGVTDPEKTNLLTGNYNSPPERLGRFTASEIWRLMGEPRNKPQAATSKGKTSALTLSAIGKQLTEQAKTYILEKVAEEITGMQNAHLALPVAEAAMPRNRLLKKEALEFFKAGTDWEIAETTFIPFEEAAGGTPDGIIESEDAVVQVKCPNDSAAHLRHLMVRNNDDLYRLDTRHAFFYQCQANLMFARRSKCYFVSYDPRVKDVRRMMHIIPIIPDVDAWLAIYAKLELAMKYRKQLDNVLIR